MNRFQPKNKFLPISIYLLIYLCYASLFAQDLPDSNENKNILTEVLEKTGKYCELLERAALDFVCLEIISEKIYISRDDPLRRKWLRKNKFVYDYQLIKKDNIFRESRILLEENGVKRNEKNAELKTSVFQYEKVLFGPIDLLSLKRQEYYNYSIISKDTVSDKIIAVLDAVPKPETEEYYFPFGKIWVSLHDFSILQVEWSPRTVKNFGRVEEFAQIYKSEPDISLVTKFSIEKKGIRFPEEYKIVEAYINKKGKKFIRSETTVLYKDYRFFTVKTDVKY